MSIQWTEERLRYLAEVNKERKIPRYFSIKKLVETIVEEETAIIHASRDIEEL